MEQLELPLQGNKSQNKRISWRKNPNRVVALETWRSIAFHGQETMKDQ